MARYKRELTRRIEFIASSKRRTVHPAAKSIKGKTHHLRGKQEAESWRENHFGMRPLYPRDDAGHKWLDETGRRSRQDAFPKLRWLERFPRGKVRTRITEAQIAQAVGDAKLALSSAATANGYLQLKPSILRKASTAWKWIKGVPNATLHREPIRRVRWLTAPEPVRQLSELPEHQREMAGFALDTGLRQANVTGLRWDRVGIERRPISIPARQSKNGKDILAPLNDAAIGSLKRRLGKHPEWVWTYEAMPVRWVSTRSWRSAVKHAPILDFRWNDLRHTCVTRQIELMEMAARKSEKLARRSGSCSPARQW